MTTRIKQRDITDCGAACIVSIAAHYQLEVAVSAIRQLASTDKYGTNVLGMIEALSKIGFNAKGVRGGIECLPKIPLPAIAHIVRGQLHHYVAIYRVSKNKVKIMDPADGQMHRIGIQEFMKTWTGILVIMLPGEEFRSGTKSQTLISRLWALISPHKAILIESFFGALAYTVIGLTTSLYIQKVVDHVLVDGNRNLLNLMSACMILLLVIQTFIGSVKNVLTLRTGLAIDARLIPAYYNHLLRLPRQFFDTMRVGEILSRVNDAIKIRAFINESLGNVVVNVLIVIFSFTLMSILYWKLALVVAMVIPIYILLFALTNSLNKKVERRLMERAAELESQWIESLSFIGTIKSFGLEMHAHQKSDSRFFSLLKTVYTSGLNTIFVGASSEFLSRLFTIMLLWLGAGFVLEGAITPGELLSCYALMGYFTAPVNGLIGVNKLAQNAFIAADRLFEIMDLEIEQQDGGIHLGPELSGNIRFVKVGFRYGSRVEVFVDFNLEILQGQVTAVVGESGSGKSTLAGLLQNLYPIQSGNIYLGEHNLRTIRNDTLRKWIGIVPQHTELFSGHVVENIAIGDDHPDMEKIVRICSGLGMMDFIESLPQGFCTPLGENGATLSGGQRQRISIARALYRDPEILILDEATSSLDSASEFHVRKMISRLREEKKTIIIIAHRLSSVIDADNIVVLEHGKVVEQGCHEELIQHNRKYYQLWKEQLKGIEGLVGSI